MHNKHSKKDQTAPKGHYLDWLFGFLVALFGLFLVISGVKNPKWGFHFFGGPLLGSMFGTIFGIF